MILRPWQPSDARLMVELFADPLVTAFPWGRPLRPSEAVAMLARWVDHWETQGFGPWAVTMKDSGVLAGTAGLSVPTFLPEVLPAVELGWRFFPGYWGRGLATEAARTGLATAFDDLSLDRVVSVAQPGNLASCRLAERLGMKVQRRCMHPELHLPLVVYEVTAEVWRRSEDQAERRRTVPDSH